VDGDIYQSGSKVHSDAYHPLATRLISPYGTRQASCDVPVSSGTVNTFELMQATSSMTANKPPTGDGPVLTFHWDNTGGWDSQLAASGQTGQLSVRGMISGTWKEWKRIYDESFHPYSDQSAALARHGDNAPMYFNWSGQGGQPPWLWGGSDGTNMYVYNPSNFSVWAARTLGAPRWAYTCNIASSASATFTHNLNNGTPIVMFGGTQGNVNINWNTSGANQIIVSQYNTGNNNWYGTIQIW